MANNRRQRFLNRFYDNPNPLGLSNTLPNNFTPYDFGSGGGSSVSSTATQNPTIAMALGGIPGGVLGVYQTIWAKQQLDKLNSTPYPEHTVSPELETAYSDALGRKDTGLSAGEKGAFQSNVNRETATNVSNAMRLGGGSLSNTISGITNAADLQAQDQLTGIDAKVQEAHMQDFYKLTGLVQDQKNLQVSDEIAHRKQLEEAFGATEASGISNITKSASSLAMLAPLLL